MSIPWRAMKRTGMSFVFFILFIFLTQTGSYVELGACGVKVKNWMGHWDVATNVLFIFGVIIYIKFSDLEPENATKNACSTGILHCIFLGFVEEKSCNI